MDNVRDVAKQTLALVLAGGRGSRLRMLTDSRAKPAVFFGGKFRIIDFALSNCVNSGITRIGVVTQYKSHSLLRHIQSGWSFLRNQFNEFIDLALEYDDVELFQYLIKPTRSILQKKEDCELEAFQETQFRRDGYVFSKQMIEKLLKMENILNSYLRSFTLTKEEWEEWNGGIVYYKSNKGRERCEELEHVPTVAASFNLLLNYLLLKGHRLSEKMLDFAVEQKKYTQSYLQGVKYMESPYPYKINVEGRVVADSYGYGCIAIVGVVVPSVYEKLSMNLKAKAKLLCQD